MNTPNIQQAIDFNEEKKKMTMDFLNKKQQLQTDNQAANEVNNKSPFSKMKMTIAMLPLVVVLFLIVIIPLKLYFKLILIFLILLSMFLLYTSKTNKLSFANMFKNLKNNILKPKNDDSQAKL